MTSEHRDGWTPRMVFINTLATVCGSLIAVGMSVFTLLVFLLR